MFEFSPFVHELWVVSERIRSDRSDGCVDSSNNLQETPGRTVGPRLSGEEELSDGCEPLYLDLRAFLLLFPCFFIF